MTDNTQVTNGTGDTYRSVDKGGVKTDAAVIDVGGTGTEKLLSQTNPMPVAGALLTGQSLAVTAATPVTGTGLDCSLAGTATFVVKNTVAATSYTGVPVIVFEQSDDNVSWAPLAVTTVGGVVGSSPTITTGSANVEQMFDAALEGVNWVRVRVTTAQATNGMTVVTNLCGMPFAPMIAVNGTVMMVSQTSTTATESGVAASASSVTLLASNTARKGASVVNDTSSAALHLRLSATAATTGSGGYTVALLAGGYYEVPFGYTGQITGIWDAATGFANVTEMT